MRRAALAAAAVAALAGCADPRVGAVLDEVGGVLAGRSEGLDEATVAAGLREALRLGSQRAASDASRPDGFFGNPLIRIPVPEQLDAATSALRTVGLGASVDRFELSMNRAAEAASAEAVDVFADAIAAMTLQDVYGIWRGGDTAATDYFRDRTSGTLRARFGPIVEQAMSQVGLARTYEALVAQAERIPLVRVPAVDLDAYVTDRSLDGLFTLLGEEEQRIREDPAARSTELLRRVFGS